MDLNSMGFNQWQSQGRPSNILDGIIVNALDDGQKKQMVSKLAATAIVKDPEILPSLLNKAAAAQQPQQMQRPRTGLMSSEFMQHPVQGVGKGLANFMQSIGYGAIGKPINAGAEAGGGWQSYIGGAIGEAAANRLKYGNTNYAARKESKLQFYNTDKDKQEAESAIEKAAQSYDRALSLADKRSQMIEQRSEKKVIRDEAMLQKKSMIKAQEDLRKYSSDASQVLRALDNIEAKTKKVVPDASRGFIGQSMAKAAVGIGRYTADENIVRYEAAVNSELIPLARKLMEEKGPITEFDVARVEKGLGNANLPLEDRLAIIADLKGKVRAALEFKREAAGMSQEDFGKLYGSLSEEKTVSKADNVASKFGF